MATWNEMTSGSHTSGRLADRATAEVAFCSLLAIGYAGLYTQTIEPRVTVILLVIFSVICGLVLRSNVAAPFSMVLGRSSIVAFVLLVAAFVFVIIDSGSLWAEAMTDIDVHKYVLGCALAALFLIFVSCLARPILAELFLETWQVREEIMKTFKYILVFGGPSVSIAMTDLPAKIIEFL